MIQSPKDCMVLASATVDLISRRQRPYTFRVTVVGKPPHAVRRIYEIASISDNEAARQGLERFKHDMAHPLSILAAL